MKITRTRKEIEADASALNLLEKIEGAIRHDSSFRISGSGGRHEYDVRLYQGNDPLTLGIEVDNIFRNAINAARTEAVALLKDRIGLEE